MKGNYIHILFVLLVGYLLGCKNSKNKDSVTKDESNETYVSLIRYQKDSSLMYFVKLESDSFYFKNSSMKRVNSDLVQTNQGLLDEMYKKGKEFRLKQSQLDSFELDSVVIIVSMLDTGIVFKLFVGNNGLTYGSRTLYKIIEDLQLDRKKVDLFKLYLLYGIRDIKIRPQNLKENYLKWHRNVVFVKFKHGKWQSFILPENSYELNFMKSIVPFEFNADFNDFFNQIYFK